jgi:acetolactate synthase-1/2/3 large subunit
MGIALPGAIAAKLVHPERKVVAFSGDGGFLMNVQELETAKRIGAAIVVVVLVDGRLGVIETNEKRQFGRTFATEFGNPDFVQLARAFGIAGYAVDEPKDLLPTLRRALDPPRERAHRGRDGRTATSAAALACAGSRHTCSACARRRRLK